MIGSSRSVRRASRLPSNQLRRNVTVVPRARLAKLARGEPRIFTAIDGMRAPFYSHTLHKIVSLWDNSN
jgi:hypothetical protein